VPSSRECTEDLRGVIVCNAQGSDEAVTECTGGLCDPDTNACSSTPPACSDVPSIAIGETRRIDLCEQSDDNTYVPAGECDMGIRAASGDAIFALTVTEPADVVIELSDVDTIAAVDTVVYLRRACNTAGSQLACDDDEPCNSTFPIPGACMGEIDVRVSRIRVRLEPGTYYIVADAFRYTADRVNYGCGDVRLRVTRG
jgi:hypothetical protein